MSSCPTGSGYDPSSAVEAFHGIPHTDIDLQSSPDQFDFSSTEYWEAIIVWACVPILTCVCIFILMSIYFICVCCCCCCGGSRDWGKKPKIGCGIVNISIVVVLLALIGVSLWAEVKLNGHIDDFLDNGRSTEDFFNQFGNESTLYTEAMQKQSLMLLEAELFKQSPQPNTQLQEVIILFTANTVLGEVFEDIHAQVEPVDLDSVVDTADNFEEIRHWVVIGYLCLVTVILLLLVVAILCGICIASPVFLIIMVVVLVFVTLTMWMAAGGSLAYLVVSGDICSDPDMLIRNLTQDQSDAVNQNVVNYYIICNESCQSNPFNEFIEKANMTFMAIVDVEANLQNYTSNSENKTLLQPLLNDVIRGFNGSRTGVDEASSCAFIHDIYLNSLQAFCADAYESSVVQFGLVCSLCVGLMVLVVTATFHTGFFCNYRKDYDEETVAYEFPPTSSSSGPSVWQSYGTNTHYNTSYTRFTEQGTNQSGPSEPPKYNDLQQPTTGNQPSSQHNDFQLQQLSSADRPPSEATTTHNTTYYP